MRGIKFRAWDELNKRMIYDYFWVGSDGNLWRDQDPHGLDMSGRKKIGPTDKLHLMRWIPLKDKNGKDIYEGDILSAERTVNGMPLQNGKAAEVFGNIPTEKRTWNEILVVEIKVNANSVSFVMPEEGGTYQERGKRLQWAIIGNIYENPDLIPQTT